MSWVISDLTIHFKVDFNVQICNIRIQHLMLNIYKTLMSFLIDCLDLNLNINTFTAKCDCSLIYRSLPNATTVKI